MIAINRYGAFEILDFVQPCLAMSTGQQTHVQERKGGYVCRKFLRFKTNCGSYRDIAWGLHYITDVEYIQFPKLVLLELSDIDFVLSDKSELNDFIKEYKK